MSFSSASSSASVDSAGSISTAPSSPPRDPPDAQPRNLRPSQKSPRDTRPNYKTLERLLLSSVDLARSSFRRHSTFGINTPTAQYLSLHTRVNKFLQKYYEFDFVRDGTYGYVLEIEILMRLAESALGLSHRGLVSLGCGQADSHQERQQLEKRCNIDVEYLVFGGKDLDVGRLPWNLESEGTAQQQ